MKTKKAEKKDKAVSKTAPVEEKQPVNKRSIENHKEAAAHHIEAAKHHMDAVKHFEAGNSEKAAHSILLAHGHHAIAGEFISDDAKHHAQKLKKTNHNL